MPILLVIRGEALAGGGCGGSWDCAAAVRSPLYSLKVLSVSDGSRFVWYWIGELCYFGRSCDVVVLRCKAVGIGPRFCLIGFLPCLVFHVAVNWNFSFPYITVSRSLVCWFVTARW